MFVVDVFTKAVTEEGKISLLFRIFFSTLRPSVDHFFLLASTHYGLY